MVLKTLVIYLVMSTGRLRAYSKPYMTYRLVSYSLGRTTHTYTHSPILILGVRPRTVLVFSTSFIGVFSPSYNLLLSLPLHAPYSLFLSLSVNLLSLPPSLFIYLHFHFSLSVFFFLSLPPHAPNLSFFSNALLLPPSLLIYLHFHLSFSLILPSDPHFLFSPHLSHISPRLSVIPFPYSLIPTRLSLSPTFLKISPCVSSWFLSFSHSFGIVVGRLANVFFFISTQLKMVSVVVLFLIRVTHGICWPK